MTNFNPILVAEDEVHIAKLVQFKLEKEGFRVVVAINGQDAKDKLRAEKWACVILDVMMPICDGWDVLKAIRSDTSLSTLPVLMLTAKGNQQDMANAAKLGATQFLKKPFDPNELATMVRRLCVGKEK